MTWKIAVFGLGCALASLCARSGASAGGSPVAEPPRVRGFSPASVHPGDAFLIDADFTGRRTPRVRVGRHAVPRSRVHLAPEPAPSGARRLWAQIPKRAPAGDHEITIATRAGKAKAAKVIRIASCIPDEPAAGGCEPVVPGLAGKLKVSGSNDYSIAIEFAGLPSMYEEPDDPGTSYLAVCGDDGKFRCLTLRMTTQNLTDIHVGTVPLVDLYYYDSQSGRQWVKDPGGGAEVLEVTPTQFRLCVNAVLTYLGAVVPPGAPPTLTVKGYVEVAR